MKDVVVGVIDAGLRTDEGRQHWKALTGLPSVARFGTFLRYSSPRRDGLSRIEDEKGDVQQSEGVVVEGQRGFELPPPLRSLSSSHLFRLRFVAPG